MVVLQILQTKIFVIANEKISEVKYIDVLISFLYFAKATLVKHILLEVWGPPDPDFYLAALCPLRKGECQQKDADC